MVRRGVMLALYSGQRGRDVVRLGPTMIDDGGFVLGCKGQTETGERPWAPTRPSWKPRWATWDRQPGPYLRTETGRAFSRRYLAGQFREAVKDIPELADATMHGLRATSVIRLKRTGLSDLMISDVVGMSVEMVKVYTRFEDTRESARRR